VEYLYETHISGSFIFDDLNKIITVILLPGVNGYSSGTTCSSSYTTIKYKIDTINQKISTPNYSFKTYVRRGNTPPTIGNAIGSQYYRSEQRKGTNAGYLNRIRPKPNVCYSSTYEWCEENDGTLMSYTSFLDYEVTDLTDPVNNFEIKNVLGLNGCVSGTRTLLYKISNGIVVFPVPTPT
jgi:hypothetical protein